MKTLTIKDESLAGDILHEITLKFEQEKISVADLIKERVTKEVEKYIAQVGNYKNSLIQPTDFERRMNNKSKGEKLNIDIEKQVYIALEAFKNNAFFIIVDDEQVENLDDLVLVNDETTISFMKLTPLVGG